MTIDLSLPPFGVCLSEAEGGPFWVADNRDMKHVDEIHDPGLLSAKTLWLTDLSYDDVEGRRHLKKDDYLELKYQ